MNRQVLTGALGSVCLAAILAGCSSPYSGTWSGNRVLSAEGKKSKQVGYSETKATMASSLNLSANGTYSAKLQEVDYTGDWAASGTTLTLTPKTYMGMERANFPATKKDAGSAAVDKLYAPYVLNALPDGKTLVHTDNLGTVTFKKSG